MAAQIRRSMNRPLSVSYETYMAALRENEELKAKIRAMQAAVMTHIVKLDEIRQGKQ